MTNATITRNDLPATEYFTRHLLGAHRSNGFDDLVGIKPDLLLCVFIIFLLTTGNFTSVAFLFHLRMTVRPATKYYSNI